MVNSHYIPQFILRSFCKDNKITYCDLDKKTVELRNTRSVFAEKGYYPEQTEVDLCKKIEYEFSVLYHNKLENPGGSIVLSENELFLLKKYLIVSAIRFQIEYTEFDLQLLDILGESFRFDLVKSLNKVLQAKDSKDLFMIISEHYTMDSLKKMVENPKQADEDANIHLWAEAKDILHSYVVFIRAAGSEKFIIPDTARGIFEGPMSRRKINGMIDEMVLKRNPICAQIAGMLTPHDYTIYPLTSDIAILSMSVFFKFFTESEIKMNVILPPDCPTVSSILGFGSKNDINPPKVRIVQGKKEYRYEVNRLNSNDISHFNCLMMAEAKHHIAFADAEGITRSLDRIKKYTDRDYAFIHGKV